MSLLNDNNASTEPCEWCGVSTSSRCAKCQSSHFCSNSCYKAYLQEHRKVCEKVELEAQSVWSCKFTTIVRRQIAQYLDVRTLCRTDSAMTNKTDRVEWQKALKGLKSVAFNTWPLYTSTNNFVGLRWGMLKRIALESLSVEVYVQNGARVPKANQFSWLVHMDYSDIARLLVESGSIEVNAMDEAQSTPLVAACLCGDLSLCEALLDAGADIDGKNGHGRTALMLAAMHGHSQVLSLFIKRGADMNATTSHGSNALHHSIKDGPDQIECIEMLIKEVRCRGRGSSGGAIEVDAVDQSGHTPLFYACIDGHIHKARVLIQAGADINYTHRVNRKQPLLAAAQNGFVDVVTLLLQSHTEVSSGITVTPDRGMMGVTSLPSSTTKMKCDVDYALPNGVTALMQAATNGHLEVVRALINVGHANPNKHSNERGTALIYCSLQGHVETVLFLLSKGADINATNHNGWNALMHAAYKGHTAVCLALVEAGSSIRAGDGVRDTPVRVALREKHYCTARVLRERLEQGRNTEGEGEGEEEKEGERGLASPCVYKHVA